MLPEIESWIVARTKPAQERVAAVNVARQCHEYYLPYFRNSDKRVVPLFPSYIFVRVFNMRFSFLNSTRGIGNVVSFGEQVATIASDNIESLMRSEKLGLVVLPSKNLKFVSNNRVRVIAGPLFDKVGLFVEYTGHERVRALFDVLGRRTMCTLNQNEIEIAA